jgi:2-iminobutanoate/2-iminopropanoate deaminase
MKVIQTDKAPKAIGPYSQAIVANGMVFCSGNIPIDPTSGNIVGEGDVEKQAVSPISHSLHNVMF